MKRLLRSICFIAIMGLALEVQATTSESRTNTEGGSELNRMKKPSALNFAINRPAPATFGLNYSYALSPLFRAEMGYGDIAIFGAKASATGVGAELMYPEWNFTPTVGLHISYVELSGTGILSLNGVNKSGAYVYSSLGMEYQSDGGFNIAMGVNIPFGGMDQTTYISAGWGFDWLKM